MPTIHLNKETDRWAWVCPAGHRSWEAVNHHFWCASCARSADDDLDPEFDELRNLRTEQLVARDDLVLITATGPVRESTATGV